MRIMIKQDNGKSVQKLTSERRSMPMDLGTNYEQVRLVIVTGLSGAGKTIVVHSFEDLGYFCVDNLPPTFIPKFAEMIRQSEGRINKIALVSDVRGGKFFDTLQTALKQLQELGIEYEILFLEANTLDLIKRFKETRRKHPLWSSSKSIKTAIEQEQKMLSQIRDGADKIIDTSTLSPKQLKEKIRKLYVQPNGKPASLSVSLMSFGFKHGLPPDADMVFDVRFLPNPYYIDALRDLSGNNQEIVAYVMEFDEANTFLEKVLNLCEFLLPQYMEEGRGELIIAIGCTGGQHRSVVVTNRLANQLAKLGYQVDTSHRDLDKA